MAHASAQIGYGLLAIFFGFLALWGAARIRGAIRRARNWLTIPGNILERGVGEPMAGPGRGYLPRVRYSYTVQGKQYENDQVFSVRGTGGTSTQMRKLVDSLPDPIPVHYNPGNPAESCLLLNRMGSYRLLVGFGALAFLFAAVQFVLAAFGS